MLSVIDQKICADKEVYAYGTAWLFQQRAIDFRRKLKILSWLSFGVPLLIGSLLSAFDSPNVLGTIKFISTILGGILALWGLWGLVAGWADSLAKAEGSIVANTSLREEWRELKTSNDANVNVRFAALQAKDLAREQADQLHGIAEGDKAKMMRASLMQYQMVCVNCGAKPTSMTPPRGANCATCSNF